MKKKGWGKYADCFKIFICFSDKRDYAYSVDILKLIA